MKMNADAAKAVIRYLMADKMLQKSVAEGHGNFYRKITGTSLASLQKRRVVLSNDHHGIARQSGGHAEAYVFFWLYLKSVETTTGVLLGSVGETVLATVMSGAAGAALGATTVTSVGSIRSTGAAVYSPAARADYASGVLSGAQRVVSAGAASAAAGTSNDFAVSCDNFELAGACAITECDDDFLVWVSYLPTKQQLLSKMTAAQGRRASAGQYADLEYVRAVASQEDVWEFDANKHKFTKVMNRGAAVKAA